MQWFDDSKQRAITMLVLTAILSTLLVVITFHLTKVRIIANERAYKLRDLHTIIAHEHYDNDLFTDTDEIINVDLLGSNEPVTVYRARKQGQPVAVVLTAIAPDGYNGRILLLIGINYAGTLLGVRVLSHQEVAGLGDRVEVRHSRWILDFNGHSLNNPDTADWKVKRDGGVFDQLSGATITSRAVVKAVHKALLFYQQQREQLFAVK